MATRREQSICSTFTTTLRPFLFRGREEVVSPQSFHELVDFDFEFRSVHLCEFLQGKCPAVKAGAEADGAFCWIDL